MRIAVVSDPKSPNRGRIHWQTRSTTCALGRSGIVALNAKREGDGATPAGEFLLRRVLWRPDRATKPLTRLPCEEIHESDGWCDDPARPEYNRPVQLPFSGSAEHLWRDDNLYDLVMVLGHNDDPPKADMGSAIFLHVAAKDFAPTQGCVAIDQASLRILLTDVNPGDTIAIGLPAAR